MILENDLMPAVEVFTARLRLLFNVALRKIFRIKLRGP